MRAPIRITLLAALLAALAAAQASAAPPAAFVYRGTVPDARTVERLFDRARRSPGDSLALSRALGALIRDLEQRGYTGARARAEWDGASPPRLVVEVREGPRLALRSVVLVTPSREDSLALAAVLPLAVNEPASPVAVSAAIDRALERLNDAGRPYASLGVSGWDEDPLGLALRISGVRGAEVTVSKVRIDGMRVTRPDVAERAMGRLSGEPYSRSRAIAGRDRLAQLGLFRSVEYLGLEGESDWSRGRLHYRVVEPRYNRFEGAAGFQGDAGVVGLTNLELGNLAGTGRELGLHWASRGSGIADFSARYVEPLLFGAPMRAEGAMLQEVYDTLYVRTRAGARLQFAVTPQDRAEVGYVWERVVEEHGETEESQLQNTVFALERTRLDSPLAPRRGVRTRLAGAQTFKTERLRPEGSRTSRAGSAEARLEWFRPLRPETGASLDLRGAWRFSSQSVLPLFERYPLGGAATLRGYDEEAFRVDRYALSRLEWSRYLGDGGPRAFLFWDHAWMGTRLGDGAGGTRLEEQHRDGFGFGLRLEAAGGLVGVDYGLEPGRPPLEGRIHLQLVSTF